MIQTSTEIRWEKEKWEKGKWEKGKWEKGKWECKSKPFPEVCFKLESSDIYRK